MSGADLVAAIPCPCGSGKPFPECHGAKEPVKLVMASSSKLKLDLGCGQNVREGFEGVDNVQGPGVKHQVNLLRYPWPFADNSVAELNASHFIEHIPAIEVHQDGSPAPWGEGQDALFRWIDECYRILEPGGWLHLIWPSLQSDRAFQDPTHRRFIPQATLSYFSKQWRIDQKLSHYNIRADFVGESMFSYDQGLNARVDEVRNLYFNHYWNGKFDFHAKLKAIK